MDEDHWKWVIKKTKGPPWWLLLAFVEKVWEPGGDLRIILCHSTNAGWVVGTLRGCWDILLMTSRLFVPNKSSGESNMTGYLIWQGGLFISSKHFKVSMFIDHSWYLKLVLQFLQKMTFDWKCRSLSEAHHFYNTLWKRRQRSNFLTQLWYIQRVQHFFISK